MVRKTHRLQPAQAGRVLRQTGGEFRFGGNDGSSSRRNQGSNLQASWISSTENPARNACAAIRIRSGFGCDKRRAIGIRTAIARRVDGIEAVQPGLHAAQALLQGLGEAAADRHRLANRLHAGGQHRWRAGKFLEGEARDLHHDVVDGRLEARRCHAGDVVDQFVERVADGKLRRDLGDRESGGLRCECRGARHPRVHLDHHHAAIGRVDRELHVGAAGVDADLAQAGDRGVAHPLVFLVGQASAPAPRSRNRRCGCPSGRHSRSSR